MELGGTSVNLCLGRLGSGVPRPGFEGSGNCLDRGFLTKKHKLGLQGTQIEDVAGAKENCQSHQQHGGRHPGEG